MPPLVGGAAPRPRRSSTACEKGFPHARAAVAAPSARRSAAARPAPWSGFDSSAERVLHAPADALVLSPRTVPLTFSVTTPPATTPRRCATATPSFPFFAPTDDRDAGRSLGLHRRLLAHGRDGDRDLPLGRHRHLHGGGLGGGGGEQDQQQGDGEEPEHGGDGREGGIAAASGKSLVGFRPRAQVDRLVV